MSLPLRHFQDILLNDSSLITLYLRRHSIPKSKFRKILIKNADLIAYEIKKQRLQILEALRMKTKTRIN